MKFQRLICTIASLEISHYAAGASFFLLLSCLPLGTLLLALLRYFPVTVQDLFSLLSPLIPSALLPLVEQTAGELEGKSFFALVSLNLITALWASSKGLHGMIAGLNRVNHIEETRGYIKRRLLCLGYTLLLLLALVLMLVLYVFGNALLDYLTAINFPFSFLLAALLKYLPLYSAVVLTAVFAAIYLALPNCRTPLRKVLPGALAASFCWIGFSYLFSYYVNHISNTSQRYGSLAIVLLLMLWLYFCMSIVFYGAFLNHLLAHDDV